MVRISALEGITYNLDLVDINSVVAPPYDVISSQDREDLYALSEYNIVKLILGNILPDDNDKENRYTRAEEYFKDWMSKGVLKKAENPCIYYYIQEYSLENGETIKRKGFLAGTYLEQYSKEGIMPHEYTMGGPKEDRLKLMKACKTNFSPIFMLYSDSQKAVDSLFDLSGEPFIDIVDNQGIRNIVYVFDDRELIDKLTELMSDKALLIADGHHRYETALAYKDYMISNSPNQNGDEPYNRVLCYYTNMDDENLKVYPTHRIVTKPVDRAKLLDSLDKLFDKKEYAFDSADKNAVRTGFISDLEKTALDNIAFGLYMKDSDRFYLYTLREKERINKVLAEKDVPEVLRKLDLSLLHKIVITDILEISEEDQLKQNGIKYIKKGNEAIEAVDNNTAELVFIMATPGLGLIREVAKAGYRMPQKSTYFYPKLLSGLVINPL